MEFCNHCIRVGRARAYIMNLMFGLWWSTQYILEIKYEMTSAHNLRIFMFHSLMYNECNLTTQFKKCSNCYVIESIVYITISGAVSSKSEET